MKQTIIILCFPLFAFFLSCENKTVAQENTEKEYQTEQQEDTVLSDNEVIHYFETFKEFLLNGKIEKLADLIHFPVEGDYHWGWCINEKGDSIRNFNPYRKKEDFIENYSKFFGKDLQNLFKKIDFEKSLQEDYRISMNKKNNLEVNLSVSYYDKTQVAFSIDYIPTNYDVGEGGIIYRFEKIEGEIKLIAIQFVGGINDEMLR